MDSRKERRNEMKKKLLFLSLLALSLTACTTKQAEPEIVYVRATETESETDYEINFPNLRTAEGIYHDYLTVETTDGNLWNMGEDSRYLDAEGNAIFTEGEKVIVLFDMWGEGIEDDIILDVHSLEY